MFNSFGPWRLAHEEAAMTNPTREEVEQLQQKFLDAMDALAFSLSVAHDRILRLHRCTEKVHTLLDENKALNAAVKDAKDVWDSVPCSYDEADAMVQKHAAALNRLGETIVRLEKDKTKLGPRARQYYGIEGGNNE